MAFKILLKEFWSPEESSEFINNFPRNNKVKRVEVIPIVISSKIKRIKYLVHIEYYPEP